MVTVHRVEQFYFLAQYNALPVYKLHTANIPMYSVVHNILQ